MGLICDIEEVVALISKGALWWDGLLFVCLSPLRLLCVASFSLLAALQATAGGSMAATSSEPLLFEHYPPSRCVALLFSAGG
jgi:hypothetical protein